MGNLSKKHYIVGIYGLECPRIPREHNKYDGYAVRGAQNCPLIEPSNYSGLFLLLFFDVECVFQGIESDLLSS